MTTMRRPVTGRDYGLIDAPAGLYRIAHIVDELPQVLIGEASIPRKMAPCGECPEGKCDRCDWCVYFEGLA